MSIIISVVLYEIYKDKDDKITKNALPLLLIPILLGPIEKQFSKVKSEYIISNQIVIERGSQIVWQNLYAVPNLEKNNTKGIINYLGVPQPLKSTYDPNTNVRLGYFENNIILHEQVSNSIEYKQLTFKIDSEQSKLSNSPTLQHLIKGKNMEFDYIQYDLEALKNGHTLLKLSTKFSINSNLPKYGEYWSSLIINDFEKNLLQSLKITLE